jgi:hypothetical protein
MRQVWYNTKEGAPEQDEARTQQPGQERMDNKGRFAATALVVMALGFASGDMSSGNGACVAPCLRGLSGVDIVTMATRKAEEAVYFYGVANCDGSLRLLQMSCDDAK